MDEFLHHFEKMVEFLKLKSHTNMDEFLHHFKKMVEFLKLKSRTNIDEFFSPKQTANLLKCSTSRLAKLRCDGEGIPFLKDGGRILYSKEQILKYLEARSHGSTSEYETSPGPGRPKCKNVKP